MLKQLKITQVKSTIKRKENQKRTMKALGLKRLHQTIIHKDVPQIRGMINKVAHLVHVEEIQ
jgi:large subunit ribosomal protein L30